MNLRIGYRRQPEETDRDVIQKCGCAWIAFGALLNRFCRTLLNIGGDTIDFLPFACYHIT